eukprot:TRINITY_DN203_c0_g1_i8.p1 TRINITY_DN203_c0_g1~~TRINITY_DN203_c0_g1_i8.p1  ORF type:complete len:192 (+),score=15.74 TRINITY_DN203_c0_g1_i8:243-818(+)
MGCAGAKGRRADSEVRPCIKPDSGMGCTGAKTRRDRNLPRKQPLGSFPILEAVELSNPLARIKALPPMSQVGTREDKPSELTAVVAQLRLEFPDNTMWTTNGLYQQIVVHGAHIAGRTQFLEETLPLLLQQGLVVHSEMKTPLLVWGHRLETPSRARIVRRSALARMGWGSSLGVCSMGTVQVCAQCMGHS